MKKKKMRAMLRFMIFTFTLLVLVVTLEIVNYTKSNKKQNAAENQNKNKTSVEGLPDGNTSIDETKNDNSENDKSEEDKSVENNSEEGKSDEEKPEGTTSTDDVDTEGNLKDNNGKDNDSGDTIMVFSGDIYLSEYIINQYDDKGIEGIISKDLLEEFVQADIAMVNEEFAFSNRGKPMEDKQFTFRIDPKYISIFQDMQLDLVTLANNHSLDYGTQALLDSIDTLDKAKIKYVGAGENINKAREAKFFEKNNKKIAFLGASRVIPVTNWNADENTPGLLTTYDPTALIGEIKAAKEESDYIVVYVHWGIERNTTPEEYQRNLAKQYIDTGADLVVGSHPHVLQGIEYYKDKPIIYSLGNFMFYNKIDKTAILKVTLKENNEVQVQLLPCRAENGKIDYVTNKTRIKEFYDYITSLSFDINFEENGTALH